MLQEHLINTIVLSNKLHCNNSKHSMRCFVSLFNSLIMANQVRDHEQLYDMFMMLYFMLFFYFNNLVLL